MFRISCFLYFILTLLDITIYVVPTNTDSSIQKESSCNLGSRRQRTIFRNLRKLMHSGSNEFSIPAIAPYVLDKFDME